MKINRGWFVGVIPALVLSISVGQIYAFTIFSTTLSKTIGYSQQAIQFAFSLGIFFLGMGAAFFGRLVENRVRSASRVGSILFLAGLITTHFAVVHESLTLLYLGYGVLLGLGTGIIYITPVKAMMMWFPKHKALASAIPIIGFGLGASVCTAMTNYLQNSWEVDMQDMFLALFAVYIFPLLIIGGCIQKPEVEIKSQNKFSYKGLLKTSYFWRLWIFMFLNISAGLCLIPLAKQLMTSTGFYTEHAIYLALIFMGISNGLGRFLFAYISDMLEPRRHILMLIIISSIGCCGLGLDFPKELIFALVVIPNMYGAGFSVLPAIISDHYSCKGCGSSMSQVNISTIHGAVLSAWGIAGLIGNQISTVVFSNFGVNGVLRLVLLLHVLNLINWFFLNRAENKREQEEDEWVLN